MESNILHLLKELQKHGNVDRMRNIAWRYQKYLHQMLKFQIFFFSKRSLELQNNGTFCLSVITNPSSEVWYKKYQWKK